MKMNLNELFLNIPANQYDAQWQIKTNGKIKVYYGKSREGYYRLSFLSDESRKIKGETIAFSIKGGKISDHYWTCLDLLKPELLTTFSLFGEDRISCVSDEKSESIGADRLRKRFQTWVSLFRKPSGTRTIDQAKGLFGELTFRTTLLKEKNFPYDKVIDGWGGPNQFSKDFAIDEKWYEIKAVQPYSASVKISSLAQLSSDYEGRLVIVYVEERASSFIGDHCSINSYRKEILDVLSSDGDYKDRFLQKLEDYGFNRLDPVGDKKFEVKKIEIYRVDKSFPALHEEDIRNGAINNVSYELIINALKKWLIKE